MRLTLLEALEKREDMTFWVLEYPPLSTPRSSVLLTQVTGMPSLASFLERNLPRNGELVMSTLLLLMERPL